MKKEIEELGFDGTLTRVRRVESERERKSEFECECACDRVSVSESGDFF